MNTDSGRDGYLEQKHRLHAGSRRSSRTRFWAIIDKQCAGCAPVPSRLHRGRDQRQGCTILSRSLHFQYRHLHFDDISRLSLVKPLSGTAHLASARYPPCLLDGTLSRDPLQRVPISPVAVASSRCGTMWLAHTISGTSVSHQILQRFWSPHGVRISSQSAPNRTRRLCANTCRQRFTANSANTRLASESHMAYSLRMSHTNRGRHSALSSHEARPIGYLTFSNMSASLSAVLAARSQSSPKLK